VKCIATKFTGYTLMTCSRISQMRRETDSGNKFETTVRNSRTPFISRNLTY